MQLSSGLKLFFLPKMINIISLIRQLLANSVKKYFCLLILCICLLS